MSSCVTPKFWLAESMKEYFGLENGSSGSLPSFVCYKAQSLEAAASYRGSTVISNPRMSWWEIAAAT